MSSATMHTMHFGPEWMRTKHQTPTRAQPPPSPPPSGAPSGASYSALVSAPPVPQTEQHDEAHPFRYSKEELLRIYREGGGRAGLGLEVERWEGVVRENGTDPIGLREYSDHEKKLFQGPLNSEVRRRQSTDFLSPLATQGLNTNARMGGLNSPGAAGGSPMTNRFGGLRRRDSGADQTTGMLPRKQSFTGLQQPLQSPRDAALPSPRRGTGFQHGFDGILGGGESWMSRRRASEASQKAGASRDGDQLDNKASDILEEVAEEGNPGSKQDDQAQEGFKKDTGVVEVKDSPADQQSTLHSELANLAIGLNPQNAQPGGQATVTPPPPIDYASVEWSYRDPTGQVQGPFRAELMQKWFDDGYFAGDLPMKRTHLDTDWITVDELKKRHGGAKIFITPPVPNLPPGLAPRTDSPQHTGMQQDVFQPAPLRNLRSSTLDGLGSAASSSPSSSYGGRFSNGSPDPQAFGGRAGFFNAPENGARGQPFLGVDPSNPFGRRNEPSFDTHGARSSAFASNMANRAGSLDGFGFNRTYSPANAWNAPMSNIGAPFDDVSGAFPGNYPVNALMNQYGGLNQDNAFVDVPAFQQNINYGGMPNGANYSPAPQHAAAQQIQQQVPGAGLQETHHVASQSSQPASTAGSSPAPASYQSLWSNDLPPVRKAGPFDAAHPTAANIIPIQPIAPSPWGLPTQSSRPGSQPTNESPWSAAPQPAPQAPTVAPIPEKKPEPIVVEEVTVDVKEQKQPSPVEVAEKPVEQPPTPVTKAEPEPPVPAQPAPAAAPKITKSKSKGSAAPPVEKKQPPPAPVQTEPTPVPSSTSTPATTSAPKAPWNIDEDAKMKTSGSTMSLREIQEAEEKKAEARKAAEREKERAARAAAQAVQPKDSKENIQPFTASWGLPTSQAGGKPASGGKEASNTAPSTPAVNAAPAPAWTTTPATAAKKTMKEIQEEEEKRKKNAAKETVAAAAARRAYAETTQKTTGPVASQGGAWTTVGSNGKSGGPPPAVRPAPTTSTSTSSAASVVKMNGVTVTPRPAAPTPVATKAAAPAPKANEPASPSVDFLKWLSSALKGLNSSVNVEEIMSMLLSFPMDPDASTVEIISELIYANSTTLDGRRFASEFISKRKADASTRPKGASPTGNAAAKSVSIAEVVKATPKPTQPEWGFKVVNKKKKGGRA